MAGLLITLTLILYFGILKQLQIEFQVILGASDLHPVSALNRLSKYADDSYLLVGSQNILNRQDSQSTK